MRKSRQLALQIEQPANAGFVLHEGDAATGMAEDFKLLPWLKNVYVAATRMGVFSYMTP